jgi:hypothetical protein
MPYFDADVDDDSLGAQQTADALSYRTVFAMIRRGELPAETGRNGAGSSVPESSG